MEQTSKELGANTLTVKVTFSQMNTTKFFSENSPKFRFIYHKKKWPLKIACLRIQRVIDKERITTHGKYYPPHNFSQFLKPLIYLDNYKTTVNFVNLLNYGNNFSGISDSFYMSTT